MTVGPSRPKFKIPATYTVSVLPVRKSVHELLKEDHLKQFHSVCI